MINYNEYKSEGGKKLSIEQCVETLRPYLRNMIANIRTSGELKIHLTMKINFMSSKVSDKKLLMHSESNSKKNYGWKEITRKLFNSLFHRYQVGLKQLIIGSNFVFDYINGLF